MTSLDNFWQELKDSYKNDLNPASYDAWVGTAKPLALTNNQLTIEVTSDLHKRYWEKHLAAKIV